VKVCTTPSAGARLHLFYLLALAALHYQLSVVTGQQLVKGCTSLNIRSSRGATFFSLGTTAPIFQLVQGCNLSASIGQQFLSTPSY
jgi:hypothetical protein